MNLYLQKHFSFKSVAALAASIDILVFGHEFGQDTAAGLQYSIDIIHICGYGDRHLCTGEYLRHSIGC